MDDYTIALIIIGDLTLTNRKLQGQLDAQAQQAAERDEAQQA